MFQRHNWPAVTRYVLQVAIKGGADKNPLIFWLAYVTIPVTILFWTHTYYKSYQMDLGIIFIFYVPLLVPLVAKLPQHLKLRVPFKQQDSDSDNDNVTSLPIDVHSLVLMLIAFGNFIIVTCPQTIQPQSNQADFWIFYQESYEPLLLSFISNSSFYIFGFFYMLQSPTQISPILDRKSNLAVVGLSLFSLVCISSKRHEGWLTRSLLYTAPASVWTGRWSFYWDGRFLHYISTTLWKTVLLVGLFS